VPDVTLVSVEEVPSKRLPRFYNLNLSDGQQLLLSFAPSLAVRLLRHEQTLLSSEAILIHFLASIAKAEHVEGKEPSESYPAAWQASCGTILERLVPRLVKHSSNTREMGHPYTLFEPSIGEPLSDLLIYLSLSEQRLIDKQVGLLVRELALITSPSGTFGRVSRVCSDPFAIAHATSSSAPRESTTWTCAFMSLVEGILRDGEDMSVLLPYEVIRNHLHRLAWCLNAVTISRLLLIDAGDPANLLVERDSEEEGSSATPVPRLTGFRDWSQGFFGDPLLSICLDNPSEGFLEGWRHDNNEDIIEDVEGGAVRLLLYRCYRAIAIIVTEYYRPRPDSSRRELEGRRGLTNVLAELSKVDIKENESPKRARSQSESGAESDESAKRQRLQEVQA
jgi:hypothetical protein